MKHLRYILRTYPLQIMVLVFIALTFIQTLTDNAFYTKFSIAMTFLVFAFKSWVNFVFSITTHRQKGETELSRSMERYFWALLAQSAVFSFLFLLAFIDVMGWHGPWDDWIVLRNSVRNLGVTAIVAVIVCGDAALEDLLRYIRRMNGTDSPEDRLHR